MGYRCPICGFTTMSAALLARHMVSTFTLYEHHFEWMELMGIPVEEYSPLKDLNKQKAFYDCLREVIKRECIIEGRKVVV
ncbi:MAG: hypothetical protein MUO92_03860 [Dehalococcoidales bacterium]|nr:hypothetical protein [Dehalococcoidales bacterium]